VVPRSNSIKPGRSSPPPPAYASVVEDFDHRLATERRYLTAYGFDRQAEEVSDLLAGERNLELEREVLALRVQSQEIKKTGYLLACGLPAQSKHPLPGVVELGENLVE